MSDVVAIDLFAGAGGLGLGAEAAGLPVALSVDNDSYSCETLRRNARADSGHVVIEGDVTTLNGAELRERAGLSAGDPLVVVGGAPCQPFSKAAYWVDKGDEAAYRRARSRGEAVLRPTEPLAARPDARRTLVQDYWRLVSEANADGFVFENVRSILHPRNRHVIEELQSAASSSGYRTRLVTATATDYGVPQARQRVFLLGSRADLPAEPEKTHAEKPAGTQRAWVTAGDALARFDSPDFAEPGEAVAGRWAEHLASIPPGQNYKWHTAWAGHPSPTWEAETRYWNFLLKLDPARPSWTIPASPGPWTGPFHWSGRRLRVVEAAALQAFPLGYQFAGSRREQIRQIGNAVPPLLGAHMVGSVVASIQGAGSAAA